MPHDDRNDDSLEDISTRMSLMMCLWALVYCVIIIQLFNVSLGIDIPHLLTFFGAIFIFLMLIYTFRTPLTRHYMKMIDRSILSRLTKFLTKQQVRENSIAVRMLRQKIERNTIPKLLVLLALFADIGASIIFKDLHLSTGAIIAPSIAIRAGDID